jgi:2-oxoglutarate ferredoxin oxidoreductase subunit beta
MEEQFAKLDIRKDENIVYKRTELLVDRPLSYCPGCGHGVVHRLIMETLEEMGIQNQTIGISPVGCSVLAYDFMNIDMLGAAHGRAPALATAIKRMWPDRFVFTYQGDGACNRGEHFTMIFINNGIYGMTGGQMAPTTLPNMKSSTSPYGRDTAIMGFPLKMTELIAQLPGTYYVTRQAVHTPSAVRKAKKAIRKAFENQKNKTGISFIEVVSNCNSGWKMTPVQSNKWMEENMFPFFPLGDIKVDGTIVIPKAETVKA